MLPSWNCSSSFEVGPRDLLCAVVDALSTARGGPSYLLPNLLNHSESILRLTDTTPYIDLRLEMSHETEPATRNAVVADVSAQDEESISSLNWLSQDELGAMGMNTLLPAWDDAGLSDDQVDANVELSLGQ